jgi:crotonobetainyl-CoA:carnitine CoA-transferase CaiB-like acyl-CoA transferase
MAQTDRFWSGLCRALLRPDLEHDPRFDGHAQRITNHDALIAVLDAALATRPLAEWAERFDANGLIWGPAQSMAEVIADPCVLANQYVVAYEHPVAGTVRGPGVPVGLSETPPRPPQGAPEYGQHTEEILLGLGYDWDEITRLKAGTVIV